MSDYSQKRHWDELIGQLSSISTQFGQIPEESVYYELGQDFQKSLRLLIMDGFAESSPLKRFPKGDNLPQPVAQDPIPASPEKPIKKAHYKPTAEPYFSEDEEPERMAQIFTQLLTRCCRLGDKKYIYADGVPLAPSKFLACLYSACVCYLKNGQKENLKAFFRFFDKIRAQMGEACPITVQYDAILNKQQEWKKLAEIRPYYDKFFIHQISLEKVKNMKSQKALSTWKEIYGLVVKECRKVGLIPPSTRLE